MSLLIDQFPRSCWDAHPNHGMLSRFWIDKHNGFRRFGAVIVETASLPAAHEQDWQAKAQTLFGQLNYYLGHLHGHHSIEDHHYFPVFRRLEPATGGDFDRMDEDHQDIAAAMREIAKLSQTIDPAAAFADRARVLDRMATRTATLIDAVNRHLDAEEDIIIPVILKHGERAIGM